MEKTKLKIGIIGGGNMGSAILSGIVRKYSVFVCEKEQKKAQALKRKFGIKLLNLREIVQHAQMIILAVKPQDFDSVLKELRGYVTFNKLVVSIAAGISCQYIEKRLGAKIRVVRTMPNLAAKVGEAMTAICRGHKATNSDLDAASHIFGSIGKTVVVEEKFIDTITAVSGSGPAYVFLFVECLNKAAKSLGLKEHLAKELVLQTLKGSLKLLEETKEDASSLRVKVTSKKGTTQAAIDVFFKNKIDKIFTQALKSAQKRAKELSKS